MRDYTHTNEFLQDYMTAANRVKQATPKPDTWCSINPFHFLGWVLVGILLTAMLMIAYTPTQEDFTDSGVGCVDDCLDVE